MDLIIIKMAVVLDCIEQMLLRSSRVPTERSHCETSSREIFMDLLLSKLKLLANVLH